MRRHDVTAVGHRLPTTLGVSSSHPRLPSTAPSRPFSNQLSRQRRSTQEPPPPADEAQVLRVTCLPFSLRACKNTSVAFARPKCLTKDRSRMLERRSPVGLSSDWSQDLPPPIRLSTRELSCLPLSSWWRLRGLPAFPQRLVCGFARFRYRSRRIGRRASRRIVANARTTIPRQLSSDPSTRDRPPPSGKEYLGVVLSMPLSSRVTSVAPCLPKRPYDSDFGGSLPSRSALKSVDPVERCPFLALTPSHSGRVLVLRCLRQRATEREPIKELSPS